jgi:hypothetical protein
MTVVIKVKRNEKITVILKVEIKMTVVIKVKRNEKITVILKVEIKNTVFLSENKLNYKLQ